MVGAEDQKEAKAVYSTVIIYLYAVFLNVNIFLVFVCFIKMYFAASKDRTRAQIFLLIRKLAINGYRIRVSVAFKRYFLSMDYLDLLYTLDAAAKLSAMVVPGKFLFFVYI